MKTDALGARIDPTLSYIFPHLRVCIIILQKHSQSLYRLLYASHSKARGRDALQGEGDNIAAQQIKYPDLAYKMYFCLQFCTDQSGG